MPRASFPVRFPLQIRKHNLCSSSACMRTGHLREAHCQSCGLRYETVTITVIILLTVSIFITIIILRYQIINPVQQSAKSFSCAQLAALSSWASAEHPAPTSYPELAVRERSGQTSVPWTCEPELGPILLFNFFQPTLMKTPLLLLATAATVITPHGCDFNVLNSLHSTLHTLTFPKSHHRCAGHEPSWVSCSHTASSWWDRSENPAASSHSPCV